MVFLDLIVHDVQITTSVDMFVRPLRVYANRIATHVELPVPVFTPVPVPMSVSRCGCVCAYAGICDRVLTPLPDMGAGGIPRPEMGIGLAADIDQTKAKHSTVFVGNITDIFPDNLVRDLLSRCGKVLKWSRISGNQLSCMLLAVDDSMTAVATGSDNLPPFGFCTFATQGTAFSIKG